MLFNKKRNNNNLWISLNRCVLKLPYRWIMPVIGIWNIFRMKHGHKMLVCSRPTLCAWLIIMRVGQRPGGSRGRPEVGSMAIRRESLAINCKYFAVVMPFTLNTADMNRVDKIYQRSCIQWQILYHLIGFDVVSFYRLTINDVRILDGNALTGGALVLLMSTGHEDHFPFFLIVTN